MGPAPDIPTGRLLERDRELAAVAGALRDVAGGTGGLLLIDAPAGVGKTALLAAARDAAADAGLLVLRARGAELERAFAFGVVRQLFDPITATTPDERVELFAGAARQAEAALSLELPADAPQDPFAVRHALYWLTANLAARQPLAILVDDAHWADSASLGALAHLAHRLDGLPVLVVITTRSTESGPELDAIRGQATGAGAGTRLVLAPLGADASAAVVRALMPDADDALCRTCHRASGGNAFLLHELARAAAAGGDATLDASPESVTREMTARLDGLPRPAARLAGAAAVLGGHATLQEAATLAGIEAAAAVPAADALVAAGVLRSVQPLEFQHPLVLAAVYDGLALAIRSLGHQQAAQLLAHQAASPERVAAQLLRCYPANDPWVVDELVAAARMAAGRGSADAAARYLRRALQEPPPPERRAEVLVQLGEAEALAADTEAAIEHLREALAGDVSPEQRLAATVLLSGLLGHLYRLAEAAAVIEDQLAALAARPDLQTTAQAALTNITRIDPAIRQRGAAARERLRTRVLAGGEPDPDVLGTVATELVMAGEPVRLTAEVAQAALVGFLGVGGGGAAGWSGFNALRTLVMCDGFDAATRVFDRVLDSAQARSTVMDIGGALAFRAEMYLRLGLVGRAEIDARTLHEIATAAAWRGGQGLALAWLGEVLLERGELDEADRLLEAGDPSAEMLARGYSASEVRISRGRLRLARGRVEEAVADLREAGRWALATGNVNPSSCGWRAPLAEALLTLGEDDEARALAHDDLERARAFGAPRALGIALRVGARVDGGAHRIARLREALDVLDGSPVRLERARVHADLGDALQAEGRTQDARESLRAAVDLAHGCGATVLEQRGLDALRATGARPRRPRSTGADALTPSERRIAELAAAGQQNREIAQALFVTTNTVEYHLRNAYRKLSISSRTDLAQALGSVVPRTGAQNPSVASGR